MPTQRAFTAGSEMPPLEPDTLRLYSMRLCPYAQRAMIVLAYKNIAHETININLTRKPEWFLKINPLGMVPVIQKNDTVVYESMVVCEYLDEVYPGEKVVPSDPYQKAKDKMFLERYSKVISKYYALIFGKDESAKGEIVKDILKGFQDIEDELNLRKSTFFGGDKPMLIDFVTWTHLERLIVMEKLYPDLAVTKDTFPQLSQWIETVSSIPAVKHTLHTPEIHMGFFKSYAEGNFDYDIGLEE